MILVIREQCPDVIHKQAAHLYRLESNRASLCDQATQESIQLRNLLPQELMHKIRQPQLNYLADLEWDLLMEFELVDLVSQ